MQTIMTKYMPATTHKGARIKATHTGGTLSVTIAWDYAHDSTPNHMEAARQLKRQLGWEFPMVAGHTRDGMVFVYDCGDHI